MFGHVEITKLIAGIKRRPALYNKNHADYTNKEVREQLWTELCWVLFPNWSDLDGFERHVKITDIQKKWRNIRDSFRREIKAQQKLPPGAVRKKRYIYHKQMKFMIPFYVDNSNQDNTNDSMDNVVKEEEEIDIDEDDSSEVIEFKFENENKSDSSSESAEEDSNQKAESPVLEMWDNNVDDNVFYDKNVISKDIDEDHCFLLSLVPTFRRLSTQQKLIAKVEFLKVLQRTLKESN